jgi:hypothetical protein
MFLGNEWKPEDLLLEMKKSLFLKKVVKNRNR